MTEFELIDRLRVLLPTNGSTVVGAGDDCAVLDLGLADRFVLFKTDAVVEGVHFESTADPQWVGHKALARCLSDVAAMGGVPTHAVVSLGLPTGFDAARVEALYRGMRRLAERHEVAIVGGEITSNPERYWISVAVIGAVRRDRCPLRSGARVGDVILVTGELGGSLSSGRHLTFDPRLAEGRWLVEHFDIHAMIDLSDGLAGDLRHVLAASGVGAELQADAIPVHPAAEIIGNECSGTEGTSSPVSLPLSRALGDGEDYELLFTLSAGSATKLVEAWRNQFPSLRLSSIGTIVDGAGVYLISVDGRRALTLHGYKHF